MSVEPNIVPPRGPLGGLWPVLRKEAIHIRRDPTALFFTVFIPVVQLFLLGYAINTNVRNVKTVVFDQARTQESRRLLDRFSNSDDFEIATEVSSDAALNSEIVAGRAKVGINIPPDFSRRLLAGETAQVLVLVDGSDSMVSGETSNVANAIALQDSLERLLAASGGRVSLPVEVRRKILFNPDSRSPNFFIPGMIVILLQMLTVMLTAFAIVRERERGTIEQLFMTPVRPLGLMVGKMVPYAVVAFAELCIVLAIMRWVFEVPINGSVTLLLLMTCPFILTMLGIGLLISTRAKSQQAAIQMTFGTLLPSIFLSGYIFPIDSMPRYFQWISRLIPATYLIEVSRGIILRGAGFRDLWFQAAVLTSMGVFLILVSAMRFRTKVG